MNSRGAFHRSHRTHTSTTRRIGGDYGAIVIGDKTSVQENCVTHARINETCSVGSTVQIGHGALLHNCIVKDCAVVGVGAVVSDYAVVGVWSIVAGGPVVASNQTVPDGKVAVGIRANIMRDVSESDKKLRKVQGSVRRTGVRIPQRFAKD